MTGWRVKEEKTVSTELELEKRLIILEGNATRRRMWADMRKKMIPGLVFMGAAFCLSIAAQDRWTAAAAILFSIGGGLLAFY